MQTTEDKLMAIRLRYKIGVTTSKPTTASDLYYNWLSGEYDADSLLNRIQQGQRQFEVGENVIRIELLDGEAAAREGEE